MNPLNVVWYKNTQNNEWFDLLRLDLDAPYFIGRRGVFAVWYVSPGKSQVIKIGSGNLAEQLKNLRSNSQVLEFSKNGPLKVSWVAVNGILKEEQLDGVEAFLHEVYGTLLGERKLNIEKIPISLIKK
jgi:hypothetical protein